MILVCAPVSASADVNGQPEFPGLSAQTLTLTLPNALARHEDGYR